MYYRRSRYVQKSNKLNLKQIKVYLCIFTCATLITKYRFMIYSVYIEKISQLSEISLVSDLSDIIKKRLLAGDEKTLLSYTFVITYLPKIYKAFHNQHHLVSQISWQETQRLHQWLIFCWDEKPDQVHQWTQYHYHHPIPSTVYEHCQLLICWFSDQQFVGEEDQVDILEVDLWSQCLIFIRFGVIAKICEYIHVVGQIICLPVSLLG